MPIYFCATIIANVLAIFVFYKNININGLSLFPLILILLMVLQATIFKKHKIENGFRTNYGSDLTADEENKMFDIGSKFLFAMIPWMIPFVFFLMSFAKMLSLFVYILGMLGGLLIYKVKNKRKIKNRINSEENEQKAQEKKEELGNWK